MSDVNPSDGSQSREGPPSGDMADSQSFRASDGTAVVVRSTPPSDGSESRSDTAPASNDRQPADDGAEDREPEPVDDRLTAEQLREQLLAARRAEKRAERELGRYRKADQARTDAEKSDLERAVERAEAAEARAKALERANQAREVAAEFGIGQWVDELTNDDDARTMRAHAQRIQARLNPGSPGMDGGVRSLGVATQPGRFEDLIRGRAGQR